jgi:hypothetical protein
MIPNIDTETANVHGAAVKDKLQAAATATREAGAAIASDLKSRAADAVGAARDAVADRAGHMADAVSDAGVRLADKVKDVADKAEGEGFPARALHLAAGGLSDAAKGLSGQSLATLLADTRAFARRNPALFVLGAAAAGFALMRLMKTSDSDTPDHGNVRPEMRNQPGAAS